MYLQKKAINYIYIGTLVLTVCDNIWRLIYFIKVKVKNSLFSLVMVTYSYESQDKYW
jgi:hypothetical protein